jgi:predicted NUDIX family NTP pyrophosphohydrolase
VATRRSAGILLYRLRAGVVVQVLVGHMGGPFWAKKEDRAWSVPKGEYLPDEEPLTAARRELMEELGAQAPAELVELGEVRQSGGKLVRVWTAPGDFDVTAAVGATFALEAPRGSGRTQQVLEIDRVGWLDVALARRRLVAAQVSFLDRLLEHLRAERPSVSEGADEATVAAVRPAG